MHACNTYLAYLGDVGGQSERGLGTTWFANVRPSHEVTVKDVCMLVIYVFGQGPKHEHPKVGQYKYVQRGMSAVVKSCFLSPTHLCVSKRTDRNKRGRYLIRQQPEPGTLVFFFLCFIRSGTEPWPLAKSQATQTATA